MHHFYGNPLSIFLPLLSLDQSEMKKTLTVWLDGEVLGEHHITHLRMLNSFRAYVESLIPTNPKEALRLLDDDTYMITQVVPALLSNIKLYQEEFKMGINLLVLLQSQFPSFSSFTSLRKSKRLLLLEALEAREGFTEKGDLVKSLVVLLRKIDEAHIGRLLIELRDFIQHDDYQRINQPILQKLDEWEARYELLIEVEDTNMAEVDRKAQSYEDMVLPEVRGRRTKTAKKIQTDNLEQLRMNGREASKIAMDIADWCNNLLT
jgi:origin recognition complex subunit 3